MITSPLIPRIGERIEQLDTAIFFGTPSFWRYPACIIRHIKVGRAGDHLWFKLNNISLDDEPGQKAPAFLFCYNKHLNYYVTVEGDAFITGLAGDLRAPEGWQDPLFAHQTTYLIRMEIRQARTFQRPAPAMAIPTRTAAAPDGKAIPFPERTYFPRLILTRPPKFNWSTFLTGLF